jgi:hypothetical protein
MSTTPIDLTSLAPTLVALLKSLGDYFRTPAAPSPAPPASDSLAPDQAIKDLQAFLNSALSLNPPLAVDGWLGPKTDAAIEAGIARLRSYGIG